MTNVRADAPGRLAVARVERRLATADLLRGNVDLEAGLAQQHVGVRDRLREDEVARQVAKSWTRAALMR